MEPSDKMTPMRAFDPDQLLAEAAAMEPPVPDASFMARLMADAQQAQPPMPMPNLPRAAPAPRARAFGSGGVIGALADVFGGRGALAAMMLATVTGLYLGVAQPAILTNLTGAVSESPLDTLDLMSGSDSLWTETIQ